MEVDLKIEKRLRFIINVAYFAILAAAAFLLLRYGLPALMPFVLAFLLAYCLKRPIRFLAEKLRLGRRAAALLTVLLFYGTIGLFLAFLSVRAISAASQFIVNLPGLYAEYAEPVLTSFFESAEEFFLYQDPELLNQLNAVWEQFLNSLGQQVTGLSVEVMGVLSGMASSLPAFFIRLVLMIIASFFIAMDYDALTGFCMDQMSGRTKKIFLQIKEYVVGTLFVCIRSYALIMSITFLELAVGLTLIGVEYSVAIALFIAVFDILPVLGTGGIMIPWVILEAFRGDLALAVRLLIVYVAITVIRNILEPKIVGSQIGLHPVVTLASMFLGAQLFGVIGLFGFPIGLSLLRHLNDTGTVQLFKKPGEGKTGTKIKEQNESLS
jgi:sporulation integral membrane protein YtvI